MMGLDPLVVATEHIAYLRRRGVPLAEAAASIGAPVGTDGWDGLTWAFARCWHEMNQGVAVSREEWDPDTAMAGAPQTHPASWISSGLVSGQSGCGRLNDIERREDCRFAPEFQARRHAVGLNFRRRPAGSRIRLQNWRAS